MIRDAIYVFKSRTSRVSSNKKKKKKILILITIFLFSFWSFSTFETKIKPTVAAMAEARAKVIATHAINEAINQEIVNKIKYDDLIMLKRDEQSKITALQTNIVKMNEMQALTSQVFQDKIGKIETSDLKIPIGNVFNSSILAGWGPMIKIRILPIGTVQSKFVDEFISAGINQTKHKVSLDVKGKVIVILPLISIGTEIVTNIPVAETIIVGDVPQTYLNVSDGSEQVKKNALGIAENLATQ